MPVHTSPAAALKPLRGSRQVGVHTSPAAAFIRPPRAPRRFLCTPALLQLSDLLVVTEEILVVTKVILARLCSQPKQGIQGINLRFIPFIPCAYCIYKHGDHTF